MTKTTQKFGKKIFLKVEKSFFKLVFTSLAAK